MKTILVTGGSGFFGGVVRQEIAARGDRCLSLDVLLDEVQGDGLRVDLRDAAAVLRVFAEQRIDGVLHCAGMLAHGRQDEKALWACNVEGTRNLVEAMRAYGVKPLVFISSNCLWGQGLGRPVKEDDVPCPVEIYGRSKVAAEAVIREYPEVDGVILRTPTIIDCGRVGLLSILFEFIAEGRRIWTVGDGSNRYQFVYAGDLARACLLGLEYGRAETFHVGSDEVKPLREVYQYVVERAGTGSRVAALPRGLTVAAMRAAYALGVSPLGPYHYKMIAEDFVFDTTRAKERLEWRPTLTNEEMLWRAYEYWATHRAEIAGRQDVSAHRRGVAMGAIRLLKWLS